MEKKSHETFLERSIKEMKRTKGDQTREEVVKAAEEIFDDEFDRFRSLSDKYIRFRHVFDMSKEDAKEELKKDYMKDIMTVVNEVYK